MQCAQDPRRPDAVERHRDGERQDLQHSFGRLVDVLRVEDRRIEVLADPGDHRLSRRPDRRVQSRPEFIGPAPPEKDIHDAWQPAQVGEHDVAQDGIEGGCDRAEMEETEDGRLGQAQDPI